MDFINMFEECYENDFYCCDCGLPGDWGEPDGPTITELSDDEEDVSSTTEEVLADLCDDFADALSTASNKLRNLSQKKGPVTRNSLVTPNDEKLKKNIEPLVQELESGNMEKYMSLANNFTKIYIVDKNWKPIYIYLKALECMEQSRIVEGIVLLHLVCKIIQNLQYVDVKSLQLVLNSCHVLAKWVKKLPVDLSILKKRIPMIFKDYINDLQNLNQADYKERMDLVHQMYMRLSIVLTEMKKFKESIAELQIGIELMKKDIDERETNSSLYGSLHNCIGYNYIFLKMYPEALSHLEKAHKVYSKTHVSDPEQRIKWLLTVDKGIKSCKENIKAGNQVSKAEGILKKVDGLKQSIKYLKPKEYQKAFEVIMGDLKNLKDDSLGTIIFNMAKEECLENKDPLRGFILCNLSVMLIISKKNHNLHDLLTIEGCIEILGESLAFETSIHDARGTFVKFLFPALNKVIHGLLSLREHKEQCLRLVVGCHRTIGDWQVRHKLFKESIISFEKGINVLKRPELKDVAKTWRIYGDLYHAEAGACMELCNLDKARVLLSQASNLLKFSTDWLCDDDKAEHIRKIDMTMAAITLYG